MFYVLFEFYFYWFGLSFYSQIPSVFIAASCRYGQDSGIMCGAGRLIGVLCHAAGTIFYLSAAHFIYAWRFNWRRVGESGVWLCCLPFPLTARLAFPSCFLLHPCFSFQTPAPTSHPAVPPHPPNGPTPSPAPRGRPPCPAPPRPPLLPSSAPPFTFLAYSSPSTPGIASKPRDPVACTRQKGSYR